MSFSLSPSSCSPLSPHFVPGKSVYCTEREKEGFFILPPSLPGPYGPLRNVERARVEKEEEKGNEG